ncbi:FHA domain-containing protein [Paenibacillus sp. WQ 127069]|uniref:FHA domain-containing protein n=1 Tax=Paenibacillus baimaensis TaxID=2982185 RepID=A0ABT2UTI3_9BACL|nr:FHA domain-containing protein [Paenibacillus sp. WQ 127069]MCU6797975.1 FHA domain-containing protein [Paenibacillus sp. WQ 127069]
MNALLYGLKVDFVTRNGHYMVLSADDGLNREQLSDFQVNMLLANKIPHLLDLQVEERDQQIKLYYNITGKKMLTQWLRMDNMSIKHFFSLLYAIVDIVGESNIYMLQEGRYVLKEDYIYCGEDLTDVHLTYIPKDTLAEKNAVSVDLQHLASRLIHKVSELSGSGYQEIMNYLMEESFNIPVFKQLLLKHRNRLGQAPIPKEHIQGTQQRDFVQAQPTAHATISHSLNTSNSSIGSTAAQQAKSSFTSSIGAPISAAPSTATTADPNPVLPSYTPPAFSPSWFEEDDQKEVDDKRKKFQIPALLVGFLVLCLVWKLYLDHPSEGWLFICVGLSVLVIDLVFIVLKIWMPGAKVAEAASWDSIHNELSQERQQLQASSGLQPFFNPIPAEYSHNNNNGVHNAGREADGLSGSRLESRLESLKQEPSADKETDSYYKSLDQHTTLLTPQDATVFLSASSLQLGVKAARPYLEWSLNGTTKVIKLEKFPFVLGRSGSGVDYGLEEPGVSRLHTELTLENGLYMMKDLGSRNGTLINGEILVPYRMYSLQEGDIVRIISTEFVFKMGS